MPRGLICSFSRGIQGVCNWDGILDCSAIYLSALERVFNAKLEISRSNKKGPFFILQENSNIFKLHVSKVWQYHETYLTSLNFVISFLLIYLPKMFCAFSFYSYFQVTYLKYLDGEDIQESAMCRVSPDKVTTTMTYLTLGTTIVLYIFPIIFLPILYTK